jgi:hypothetical protein
MPVTSMVKLARVDFANTDPAQLRAAVKLPRTVRPRPQGVALRISVKLASGHEAFEDFTLREVSQPNDLLDLRQELDADSHIFAYRLDEREVARLAAFRDGLQEKQAARGGKGGALAIAVRPDACRTGELSGRTLHVTTYLRTMETAGYVPLARDVDLRTLIPDAMSPPRSRYANDCQFVPQGNLRQAGPSAKNIWRCKSPGRAPTRREKTAGGRKARRMVSAAVRAFRPPRHESPARRRATRRRSPRAPRARWLARALRARPERLRSAD